MVLMLMSLEVAIVGWAFEAFVLRLCRRIDRTIICRFSLQQFSSVVIRFIHSVLNFSTKVSVANGVDAVMQLKSLAPVPNITCSATAVNTLRSFVDGSATVCALTGLFFCHIFVVGILVFIFVRLVLGVVRGGVFDGVGDS